MGVQRFSADGKGLPDGWLVLEGEAKGRRRRKPRLRVAPIQKAPTRRKVVAAATPLTRYEKKRKIFDDIHADSPANIRFVCETESRLSDYVEARHDPVALKEWFDSARAWLAQYSSFQEEMFADCDLEIRAAVAISNIFCNYLYESDDDDPDVEMPHRFDLIEDDILGIHSKLTRIESLLEKLVEQKT